MFLCEDCHFDEICAVRFLSSRGPCENCKRVTTCYDCRCGSPVRTQNGPERLAEALDVIARASLVRALENARHEADLGPGPEDDDPGDDAFYAMEEEAVPDESGKRALDPDGWCC